MPLCHSPRSFVLKVVSNRRSRAIGEEKQVEQPEEDKRRKERLRKKFIENKRLLNHRHMSLKKDKHLETKTTKRTFLMF